MDKLGHKMKLHVVKYSSLNDIWRNLNTFKAEILPCNIIHQHMLKSNAHSQLQLTFPATFLNQTQVNFQGIPTHKLQVAHKEATSRK